MATYTERVRQGLPRVVGGAAWPADGIAADPSVLTQQSLGAVHQVPQMASVTATPEPLVAAVAEVPVPASGSAPTLRRGLPRVPGGEPWPAGGVAAGSQIVAEPSTAAIAVTTAFAASESPLRRGLPRVPGGAPWPAEGFAPESFVKRASQHAASEAAATIPETAQVLGVAAPTVVVPTNVAPAQPTPAPAPAPAPAQAAPSPAQASPAPAKPAREPIMIGEKSLAQWVKIAVLGAVGAIFAAGIIVLAARGVTTLPGVPEWLQRYPGQYDLPESSVDGFPAWARWGHFFNLFLIVLIIRSGLLVRTQQQPPAFWTPKKGGKKISINLWLHTSLDVLWVVNGLIFVVLLFVSGHWMRIVPTSWEVIPNAASAMLQYLTLDWPVEDGWVNYNSLQQIMYFLVVFIAAPVAIITGVRMSEWWPQDAAKLNKLYPAPLARAIHFPTMLFFVLFIIVHVFLVFTTGALKNLNHMFVGAPVVSWTGFWLFALAIAITVGGWFACKPLVIAPIANLFGRVSNR